VFLVAVAVRGWSDGSESRLRPAPSAITSAKLDRRSSGATVPGQCPRASAALRDHRRDRADSEALHSDRIHSEHPSSSDFSQERLITMSSLVKFPYAGYEWEEGRVHGLLAVRLA
jgi:hypothetical protein